MRAAWLIVAIGCSGPQAVDHPGDGNGGGDDGTAGEGPPQLVDDDLDGLDDRVEQQLAEGYLPFVSLDPNDGCPLDGFLVRVRPHPADATKVLIVYDHLLQRDCGLGGHVGDDEVFGVAIDPARSAPDGILAIKTASHQGTICERDSECSTCGDGRTQCDRALDNSAMWPVLYASKDKHGQYAVKSACSTFGTCFDQCTLSATRRIAPVTNAGEPDHPLVHDLTDQGFITAANGWTEAALQHVDPWAPGDFGGAGAIADDLIDSAFEVGLCP